VGAPPAARCAGGRAPFSVSPREPHGGFLTDLFLDERTADVVRGERFLPGLLQQGGGGQRRSAEPFMLR
jgi:hypothetical protein